MAHDPIYLLQETMGYSQEQRKNSFIERRKTEKTGRSRLRPHHKLELLKVLLRLDLVGDILAPVEEMGQCPIYQLQAFMGTLRNNVREDSSSVVSSVVSASYD
jgi:hypothetical protein